MKNLNILAVATVVCVSFIGCGDTKQVSDNKVSNGNKTVYL